MEAGEARRSPVTFITLGPTSTCHERAVTEYAAFQGVEDYRVELIVDFFVGLEMLRETPGAFLVQCSAHPKVHEITEKYWTEVWVVDTFIYPTKHLVLLTDAGLVTAEPGERRRVRYRLRSAPMKVAQQFLAALARDWDSPLNALKEHLDRGA